MIKFKAFVIAVMIFGLISLGTLNVSAEEIYDDDSLPEEYGDFIGSLDSDLTDLLPDGAISDSAENVNSAADALSKPQNVLAVVAEILGEEIKCVAPTLALLIGIVMLSALMSTLAASNGLSRAVEICTRLATFCTITGVTVNCAESLSGYFEHLFSAVASFIPLSGVMLAMGGNLNAAASGSVSLGVVLTVCQFFCTQTAIPIFCICMSLTALSAFDSGGTSAGVAVSASIRKWYMIALSFIMMILTVSLSASTMLAAKADNMAMRGAKFAVGSFIPVTGGTLSSTLGTLAASVELLRGSVGTVGIFVIIFTLLPTVIELALMRGVFALTGFCASALGCVSEARLLTELDSLYGFLEGLAALSGAVFVIALGIFAGITTPFS